ncbi:ImmA/IrrE family metallo-endopeptidase [Paenibacillus thiaminolyticus]|uniref:ImmA/IrrE family metallo-endopeptidase n=1 Tax=Paenibacillus thiaminolyticus TaxID=49283 RepID=UPI0011652B54|nr:ImmA/IrrE family metallo-endopeptidase [Paenibacillus thiaminolyticus]
MDLIKQTVSQISNKYQSNEPGEIAAHRNVLVLYEELGDVFGYFNTFNRIQMIHINHSLEKEMQRFVMAHELGHSLLHSNLNTPFMKRYTLFAVDRIEREANRFAVELLLPDALLEDGMSLYDAAAISGVPKELACLKSLPKNINLSAFQP